MTDGGCLSNAPLRDASPILDRALSAAVEAYDRERQRLAPVAPLQDSRKAAMRPLIAAAVEAYLGVVGARA